ncbi:hypothetical protein SAMN00120144_2764 [Hymenobacter roseosalivarius DSM 11622]|uniref:Sporulation domain protein n=1 Tax=Hymenobacter roseosalivarius DSM 11622 TaxID=645990 RepID=A0A1W1VSX2_9BACT|nr:hypothetical protein [Hymenobacter roseosalivarius]SMB96467.1 hypothetical protein SAMN00120144_2764 [Hymenobacter roseosalivarius DSM 11622]
MKFPLRNVFLFSALLSLASCAASGPVGKTTTPDTTRRRESAPAEDLSRYRPVFTSPSAATTPAGSKPTITPTNHVNSQIDQRLRDQAFTNQNVKYAQGYRILAYVGLERDQAMAIRRAVISRYPEETDYMTFKQPTYRLLIGDYMTRLEAEQAMLRIKPLAPRAQLQPAQVVLNKTRF